MSEYTDAEIAAVRARLAGCETTTCRLYSDETGVYFEYRLRGRAGDSRFDIAEYAAPRLGARFDIECTETEWSVRLLVPVNNLSPDDASGARLNVMMQLGDARDLLVEYVADDSNAHLTN